MSFCALCLGVCTLLLLGAPARSSAQQGRRDVVVSLAERLRTMPGSELIDLGLHYINDLSQPDSAMLCFTAAANRRFLPHPDSADVAAFVNGLNLMGLAYKDFYGDYQKSFAALLQAEQEAERHGCTHILPKIHNNLAAIDNLNTIVDHSDASIMRVVNMYKKAYYEARQMELADWLPVVCSNMAVTAMSINAVDSVKAELRSFLGMKPQDAAQTHRRLLCRGVLAYGEGHYDDALQLFRQSCDSVRGENAKTTSTHLISAHNMMVQLLLSIGREREALQEADSLIGIARTFGNNVGLLDIYEMLYNHFSAKGDEAAATRYELLYLRQKDIIMNQCKLADIGQIRFLNDIEQMSQEARDLARRHALQTNVLYAVVAFLLVIVCMLLLLFRQYRQLKAKNRQLYQNSLELLARHEEEVRQREADMQQQAAPPQPRAKYQNHVMAPGEREELLHRIFLVMERSADVYAPSFSLQRLAELVGENPNYVSQVINEHYGRNFNALLSEYRVKEACRRINDEAAYGHMTLEGIALSVGIKSRTNFSVVFKQQTGLTPSEYMRLARRRQA